MVEVNLKRAIREEKERQTEHGIVPDRLRQVQASEEDDDDETTAGPTTIGPAPGDIVKGVAMIITSLGTFDVNSFWGSFVNFFPPAHRESAQAVVDASQGRRPLQWPTLPTTTTKLTTTTKDEDEIDSEEITTAAAIAATVASVAASSPAVAVTAPVPVATVATEAPVRVNVAATRPPVSRYTVRPRTSALEGAPGN
ncbi:unnamed protein product [Orchesella dallaii]|uniref:Uncharacterized protein n=1 Tax=Orchesella dallaii TaxID=48710 RepID=A0ABP1QXZ7_9HEXA